MSAERRQGRDRRVADVGPPPETGEREQQDRRGAGAPDESARQAAGAVEPVADSSATVPPRRRTGVPPQQEDRLPPTATHHPADATRPTRTRPPAANPDLARRLLAGDHADPHSILGAHPETVQGTNGIVVRAMHPDAAAVELVVDGGDAIPMEREMGALFSVFVPDATLPMRYRLRFHFAGGATWDRDDPYHFFPTIGEIDAHLFAEGTHRRLWEKLGAHIRTMDGTSGVAFAVWAPNARRVSVVGDFCAWDGRVYPMRTMGSTGLWELFIPEIHAGALYKYELLTKDGLIRLKTDPFAFKMEQMPGTASIVVDEHVYTWEDREWMDSRPHRDAPREPMLIYEVHLGSWARVPENENRSLTYRELAPRLVEHVTKLGFTHIELLPVSEHPFTGSWGYQVSGYYAPTSRYGTPDDFRYLVDMCHRAGIGVILDWVPAHFPKDDFALRRFDGTALYEHEDPRLGEHPDWGTLIFNYGRPEVRNFLIANALFWLDEYHVDGVRVDAVASMLYLDYSRRPGEWLRNRYGGRENLEAIDFLRQFNDTIRTEMPGCVTIAEESTAWPGVTKPASEGGLGFTFKWNMGWMHDTLRYFARDPIYRHFHQGELTFAMVYEYHERFIMPLSHDEVVHLKRSLLDKMPGDLWQKLANLRLLLAYQYTRPGKKLLFMGTELAPWAEWNHDSSLDWHFAEEPERAGFVRFVEDLGRLYRDWSPLWRYDHVPSGFAWIDLADEANSVISYARHDGHDHVIVVMNFTPIPHEQYRIGVPSPGRYKLLMSTDNGRYGGSGIGMQPVIDVEGTPFHGYPQSVALHLPPLGALVLAPEASVARITDGGHGSS
ncbi:MAG: 1,4-alpha-glucan branching protein GlgB [Gemmatimonadaceae bacterium]